MSYNVLTIPPFDRQLKRLAKKFPSLKMEYAQLLESLETEPVHFRLLNETAKRHLQKRPSFATRIK